MSTTKVYMLNKVVFVSAGQYEIVFTNGNPMSVLIGVEIE